VPCNCGKSKEQKMAEIEARRVRLEELTQARREGKVGPSAPGYFSKQKTADAATA
jgi:uncharacterized protein YdbL (DUF1318 family)